MEKRISLTDVARDTGFTVATVSKALRGLGSLPEATRKKINDSARTLGYYPNPLLASLASKRFSTEQSDGTPLAYIHCPQQTTTDDAIALYLLNLAQEHARKLGYRLNSFQASDFKDGAQATRILFSRGVQGIVLPPNFHINLLPGMDWNRFSVVGWGESIVGAEDSVPLLYRAAVNHFGLILRAWEETWKQGYRRIGFALFAMSSDSMDDQLRWGAIQCCLKKVPPRLRIAPYVDRPGGEIYEHPGRLAKWARRYRPDAVLGFNSVFRWALEHTGFRIPDDLGFASLHKEMTSDGSPLAEQREPGMQHMNLDSILAALELLDQQIRHHRSGLPRRQSTLLIHSEWLPGDSLPKKKVLVSKRTARPRRKR